jgi:hypothetical protein
MKAIKPWPIIIPLGSRRKGITPTTNKSATPAITQFAIKRI